MGESYDSRLTFKVIITAPFGLSGPHGCILGGSGFSNFLRRLGPYMLIFTFGKR